MWPEPVILVATESVQQRLLRVETPLQQWLNEQGDSDGYACPMPISRDCYHHPEAWLAAQLENRVVSQRLPP